MVHVKVCCIASTAEAELAKQYGAHALGFVSKMPAGDRWISDEQIQTIIAAHSDINRFLLTCQTDSAAIRRHLLKVGADTIQLVNELEISALSALRISLVETSIVQVIHVTGPEAVNNALRIESYVDAIVLDSGNLGGPTPSFGGTGSTHDWDISAKIVSEVNCPVYLAGGLGPDNVVEAIHHVQPYGVDVCSGLRIQGKLDETLVANFFEAVASAS